MRHWFVCLLFVTCLFASFSVAQEPLFKNFTVDNGLPSSEVYRIKQDSKGYIWFATDFGVARYNGNAFNVYTTKDGLQDNTNFSITEDYKGRIWFHGFSGKISYFQNKRFYPFHCAKTLLQFFTNDKVNNLYVDRKGVVWVALKVHGVFCKIKAGTKSDLPKLRRHTLLIREFESGEAIWSDSGTNATTTVVIHRKGKKSVFQLKTNLTATFNQSLVVIRPGVYAFGSGRKIIVLNEKKLIAEQTFDHDILTVYFDGESLWVGFRDGGVIRLRDELHLKGQEGPYLREHSVTNALKDKEGGYWFSTLESGVFYTPSFDFLTYTTHNTSLTANKVEWMAKTGNNSLYFGLANHELYRLDQFGISLIRRLNNGVNKIRELYADKHGNLYIAKATSIETIPRTSRVPEAEKLPPYVIHTFFEDKRGDLWIGHAYGLSRFERASGQVTFYLHSRVRAEAISEQHDTLYVGTIHGVFSFANGRFSFAGHKYPLLANRVKTILQDKAGRLWFATRGAGLLVKDKGRIWQITEQDGLISDLCNTLWIDPRTGNVWVATNKGVSVVRQPVLSAGGLNITSYTRENGLASSQVNTISRLGDKMFFGTSGGLSVLDLVANHKNTNPPPVYIARVLVNGKERRNHSAPFELIHDQNDLLIEYEGLSYKNAGKIPYRYKLSGIDDKWNYTYGQSMRYTELPPGEYTFRAQAANNDGVWSHDPAVLNFVIYPAFYQTYWFLFSIISLSIAMIWLIFHIRFRRMQEQNRLHRLIVDSEQKALRLQMNPHFIFNSLNSIQYYILENDRNAAQTFLSRFARLIRSTLDFSEQSSVKLHDEIAFLRNYLEIEQMRFEGKFSFRVDVDDELDLERTRLPVMLIQPFVENAVTHAFVEDLPREGLITLAFRKSGNTLECRIEDNGSGRKSTESPVSDVPHSMTMTQNRIAAINKGFRTSISLKIIDKFDRDRRPEGTLVLLEIPLNDQNSYHRR